MKLLFALLLLFASLSARADMPYMPLKFRLSTAQPAYFEGDKIEFVLIIKNEGTKTYPILLPGGANSGNKLIYLRAYDPAPNLYVERAMEAKEMSMSIKHIGITTVDSLKPGDSLSIRFFWNDMERFFSDPDAHHSFGKPLFAGQYLFQAFYDPGARPEGRQLYHFLNNTDDSQSVDKLNFMGVELSAPCLVTIKHQPAGRMHIEFGDYIRVSEFSGLQYYKYYLGSVADSNQVHFISEYGEGLPPRLEVSMHHYNNTEWIERYPNGHIRKHSRSRQQGCPDEYYVREYYYDNEKQLAVRTDMDANGSVHTSRYCYDGSLLSEEHYLMPAQELILTRYLYKNGRLQRKKTTKSAFRIPCEMTLEIKE